MPVELDGRRSAIVFLFPRISRVHRHRPCISQCQLRVCVRVRVSERHRCSPFLTGLAEPRQNHQSRIGVSALDDDLFR